MKTMVKRGVALALLPLAGAWVWGQLAAPAGLQPVQLLPAGAMVVLQSGNAKGLLGQWNASPQKQEWLQSEANASFSRSRLFYRLEQAGSEFAAAAGVTVDGRLAEALLGGATAVGLYETSTLDFVLVSQMEAAQFAASGLGRLQGSAQARSVGGTTFYVKQGASNGPSAAFALVRGHLLLATNPDRMAEVIRLMAGNGSGGGMAGQGWFQAAQAAAGAPGELRMTLHLPTVVKSPHFRSYWLHANRAELGEAESFVSDLRREGNQWRDARVLLRSRTGEGAGSGSGGGERVTSAPELLRAMPADAAFYRVAGRATAGQVGQVLAARLSGQALPGEGMGGTDEASKGNASAPMVYTEGVAGAESDMETMLDAPAAERAASGPSLAQQVTAALQAAALEASSGQESNGQENPSWGYAFVGNARRPAGAVFSEMAWAVAVAKAGGTGGTGNAGNWAEAEWRAKIGAWAGATYGHQALRFSEQNGIWSAAGLQPLHVAFRGRLLLLSNDAGLLQQMRTANNGAASGNVTRAAGWQHGEQRGALFALLQQADRPYQPEPVPGQQVTERPGFLTGTMASLSRMFRGVGQMRMTRTESAERITEVVTYEWAQ